MSSAEDLSRPPSVDCDSDSNSIGAAPATKTGQPHKRAAPPPPPTIVCTGSDDLPTTIDQASETTADGESSSIGRPATTTNDDDAVASASSPSSANAKAINSSSTQQSVPSTPLRICLVGPVIDDPRTVDAARSFGVPVVTSETGDEFVTDTTFTTFFVLAEFEGPMFEAIQASGHHRVLGPPALHYHQTHGEPLAVSKKRPIYNYSMKGVITCFTGIRNKGELTRLVHLIHSMGGSIRSGLYSKVTHLICNTSGGPKYQYAMTFRLDVVRPSWVHIAWEQRDAALFDATQADFTSPHRLKPFEGQKICFLGFAADEHQHMIEVLLANGGTVAQIDDPDCSHVVTDTTVQTKPEPKNENTHIVKPDWFWYSIQNGFADENEYLYKDYLESIAESATPSADRRESLPVSFSGHPHYNKRKRKLLQQRQQETTPSGSGKRRSSVSDAGLLSASGSLLDYTASPSVLKFSDGKKSLDASASEPKKKSMRYNHFMDLFGTESNYVGILHTIVSLFQKPLEEMADKPDALLNKSEVRAIFSNFSPIYDVHLEMLNRFNELQGDWSEDCLIGKIIIDHREALIKAYPPYVNFFEQMRDALVLCDAQNPRFHAFLKINQAKAECGRQTLQDLMIRPVQRLPSISLLISDILKHTPKTNPDHKELEKALKAIKEVLTYINEDKLKMEGRLALFDIFNDIEGCPPDLVASHRKLVLKCEVTELSNTLSGRDDALMLFLFTDYMEVCKIKKSRFTNVKSPITTSTATLAHGPSNGTIGRSGVAGSHSHHGHQKSYKHVKLLPLKSITTVCDIQDGPRAFALCAAQKDKVYAFNINDEIEKCVYLKGLCKQLAEKACTTDADQFLRVTESAELNIDISDLNLGTLKKAFNYARTRLKVTRAFSFNKTPMKLIKRPVISPQFGSTNSLTPATQLAKMKLASCTNINEVGAENEDDEEDDDTDSDAATKSNGGAGVAKSSTGSVKLIAPMSVQPVRKATLTLEALRRL